MRLLFDLIAIIGQDVSESGPALFWDGDGRAKVGLDLTDAHIHAAVVLADVEVKVLVVDVEVPALRQVGLVRVLVAAELVEQVREGVPELDHALRRYRDLRTGPAPRYRLRDAQEPAPRVLLQVQVVTSVVLHHHLALQLAVLGHGVRIRRSKRRVKITERTQMVSKFARRGQGKEYL